jgi:hypothetical protein
MSFSYANSAGVRSPLDTTNESAYQRFDTQNAMSPTVILPDFEVLEAKRLQKLT